MKNLKPIAVIIFTIMVIFIGASAVSAQDGGAIDGAASAEFIPEAAGDFKPKQHWQCRVMSTETAMMTSSSGPQNP